MSRDAAGVPAASRYLILLPGKGLQGRPRHISRDVPLPVRRLEICRLHQRIDVGNLIHTLLLRHSHAVASFRSDHTGFGTHLGPPGYKQIAGPTAGRDPLAAILTPPCLE
jgi:hypothetical protein